MGANVKEVERRNNMMADTMGQTAKDSNGETQEFFDDKSQFDSDVHELIDLDKCHTDYRRFNSRYDDDDLDFNDVINVLVPAEAKSETSNVLLFELILLKSAVVKKDYVVGWGVFPLVNSEFQINEGKFKCPLLFGPVDKRYDKFNKIEEKMIDDLDNWLCNVYFEIEKVNLMDLKTDEQTDKLYFSPLHKLVRKKRLTKEEFENGGQFGMRRQTLMAQKDQNGLMLEMGAKDNKAGSDYSGSTSSL